MIATGAATLARRRHRSQTLVLAYHNIVPAGERPAGDRSLHLAQKDFAQQLDQLQRTHDIVPLAELAHRAGSRPRAVITFDDAYAGAVAAGVDELRKRSLPATIFVAPGLLNGMSFWWDELARGDEGLAPDVRSHALDELAGKGAAIKEWAVAQGLELGDPPAYQRGCREETLESVARTGLITFGCHTWSHANLARLATADAEDELKRSWEWLRSRFSNVLPCLAYPYGLQNATVRSLVEQTGFQYAFLIEGGWIAERTLATAPFALPRLNVPAGISLHGFVLRASGML